MNATAPIAVSPTVAATMLGISRTKIYELLYTEIPVRKIGRRSLIAVADIERWLAAQPAHESAVPSRAARYRGVVR
jgi:excisionase family DNA binding protein